jgi:hypothetical protein
MVQVKSKKIERVDTLPVVFLTESLGDAPELFETIDEPFNNVSLAMVRLQV